MIMSKELSAELDALGVIEPRGPKKSSTKTPSSQSVGWKPSFAGEEPPF